MKKKQKKEEKASSNDYSHNGSCSIDDIDHLTNKKKEYLQEIIEDKNGVFTYLEDPNEYKRARK